MRHGWSLGALGLLAAAAVLMSRPIPVLACPAAASLPGEAAVQQDMPVIEFLGRATSVHANSPTRGQFFVSDPGGTVTYGVVRVLRGDLGPTVTLPTEGALPEVGELYTVPVFRVGGVLQAGEFCGPQPYAGNATRLIGYVPVATPTRSGSGLILLIGGIALGCAVLLAIVSAVVRGLVRRFHGARRTRRGRRRSAAWWSSAAIGAAVSAGLVLGGVHDLTSPLPPPPPGPTGVELRFMAAYNTLAAALPSGPEATQQPVAQQRAAIETFASTLSSIRLPASLHDQSSALQAATSHLLDSWTVTGVNGPSPAIDVIADPTAIDALHTWYAEAAPVANALGLSSETAVAYPTVSPAPTNCTTQIPFTRPKFDLATGVLTIGTGVMPGGCAVDMSVTLTLVDAEHNPLAVQGNGQTVRITITPAVIPLVGTVWSDVVWSNWCGGPGDDYIHVQSGMYDNFVQLSAPTLRLPTCRDGSAPSTLTKQ